MLYICNGDDDDVLPGGSEPDVGEGLLGLEQDEEGHHQPPGHKSSYSCFKNAFHSKSLFLSHFFLTRQVPKIEHYTILEPAMVLFGWWELGDKASSLGCMPGTIAKPYQGIFSPRL